MIDIEAIERAAAAAEGPWYAVHSQFLQRLGHKDADLNSIEDAAFIAHARSDIPALLAAHKDLVAALELFVHPADANHGMSCHCKTCTARAALLRARGGVVPATSTGHDNNPGWDGA